MRRYKPPPNEPAQPQSLRVIVDDGETILEGKEVFDMFVRTASELAARQERKPIPRALPLRDVALIHVLYYTGLRASEVAGLTESNFVPHRKSGGAYFEHVVGKGGGTRESVYLQPEGLKPLSTYMRNERSYY
ncbi:MAG TPA: hypothetical protein DCP92_09990 [Nitrospiraceae bacterium]|nr:hypothetical protein [Nitrospiraceae bacterium]